MGKQNIHHGNDLGNRIASLREGKGWSKTDLAAACGVTQTYIRQLENGERCEMGITTALAMAEALDVQVELMSPAYKEKVSTT